jgi:hypothetical protein
VADFDLPRTGEDPDPDETSEDPEALAAELDLGIDLSPEEQEEANAMVARLRSQFGLDEVDEDGDAPEPVPDEAPIPEPDGVAAEEEVRPPADPISAPVVGESPAPASTRGVVIDGREVPVEEAVAYLAQREREREAAAAAPEPPKPPEWLDQDDPAQMAMWQRQVELERQVQQIGQNQATIAKRQEVARAQSDAEAGIHTFRTLHPELSEEDLTTIRLHAVSLDIIDGLARHMNGPEAIAKALDIAYWDHPEYRAKATQAPSPAEAKKVASAEKKSKLNALGGSSGSAPRREAKPDLTTDAGAKKAAAEWLKEQGILER